jgi:hypothetical protein
MTSAAAPTFARWQRPQVAGRRCDQAIDRMLRDTRRAIGSIALPKGMTPGADGQKIMGELARYLPDPDRGAGTTALKR